MSTHSKATTWYNQLSAIGYLTNKPERKYRGFDDESIRVVGLEVEKDLCTSHPEESYIVNVINENISSKEEIIIIMMSEAYAAEKNVPISKAPKVLSKLKKGMYIPCSQWW